MEIPKTKNRFMNLVLEYFELLTKKSQNLEKCAADENKRVRYSMPQQLLGKNVFLPQSLAGPECLAKKFNAFFVKKIEAVLASILLTNGLKLNNSHTTTLDTSQVFTLSDLKLLLPKFLNSSAPNDIIPLKLCKIVLKNSPDYFIA